MVLYMICFYRKISEEDLMHLVLSGISRENSRIQNSDNSQYERSSSTISSPSSPIVVPCYDTTGHLILVIAVCLPAPVAFIWL
jgi:hypothetical protein